MHAFRMLGGIGLATNGHEVDALLRQPKRIALFAYLAMPRPGTWHRRDTLTGVFWPELDQGSARTSLRNALYVLRQNLDDGAIRTRGDDEIALNADLVTTDVAALEDDVAAGRHAEALERYQGPLLAGLFIPGAEGFEKWLDVERTRLLAVARRSAALLTQSRETAGDLVGAVDAARRATELSEEDEAAARRLIALLDRVGERSQAMAAYERFRKRIFTEFQTEPSNETRALVEKVRAHRSIPSTRVPAPVPAPANVSIAVAATEPDSPAEFAAPDVVPLVLLPRSRTWWWGVAAALVLSVVGIVSIGRAGLGHAASGVKTVVVLPMDNETGDPEQDYVATGVADELAQHLSKIGGLSVRSGARSEWPDATRHDLNVIAGQFGATILIRTRLTLRGDSLEVRASVADVSTGGETEAGSRRFTATGIRDVASQLAAVVAGTILRVPIAEMPRPPAGVIDSESDRLTYQGWQQQLAVGNRERAKELFTQATKIDPLNARAWSGLSSAWSAQAVTGVVPFDEGYERAEASARRAIAIDSTQGSAWANLGILRALRYRSLSTGEELLDKAARVDPGNAEVVQLQSAVLRFAWRWDESRDLIRVARRLDPLATRLHSLETALEFCVNRPDAALRLSAAELAVNPSSGEAQSSQTRALAALGRYDEAIESWRKTAVAGGNTALADRLAHARGARGYWDVMHEQGTRRLAALEKKARTEWVRPFTRAQALFAAGDTARGFLELESELRQPDHQLFRLPCNADFDEVRNNGRFAAIVKQSGPLPAR